MASPQRAHIGRRHQGRLRRRARLETVRAHQFGSLACKPSAGSPSGRRMAPRSTASATARNRPRCTDWCSSTQRPSSPRPKTLLAQTAAHLMHHVIPHVPVRQWVLSLPIPLHLLLAAQPKLVTLVLPVVLYKIDHPIDEVAHTSGGVGRRGGLDLHGGQRWRFGRGLRAQVAAGCGRGISGSVEVPWRPETTRKQRPGRTIFGGAVNVQQPSAALLHPGAALSRRRSPPKTDSSPSGALFGVPWGRKKCI